MFMAWAVVILLMLVAIANVAKTQVSKGAAFQYAAEAAPVATQMPAYGRSSDAQVADAGSGASGLTLAGYSR